MDSHNLKIHRAPQVTPKKQWMCDTVRRQRERRWRLSSGLLRTRDISFATDSSHIPGTSTMSCLHFHRIQCAMLLVFSIFWKKNVIRCGCVFHVKEDQDTGTVSKTSLCHWSVISDLLRNENYKMSWKKNGGKSFVLGILLCAQGKTTVSLHRIGRSENGSKDWKRWPMWKCIEIGRDLQEFTSLLYQLYLGCAQRVAAVDKFVIRIKSDLFDRSLHTYVKDPCERQLDENQRRKVK